jgi:hypothetical protein
MFEIFGTRRMSKQFRVRRRHDKACQAAVVRIGQSELCPTLTPGPRVVRPADPPSRWTPRAKTRDPPKGSCRAAISANLFRPEERLASSLNPEA